MARLAYEEGLWLDVATGGEAYVALSAGVPANRLVFHGNNKSASELEQAIRAGVGRIVVDSFDEIDRIEKLLSTSKAEGPSFVDSHQRASRATPTSKVPSTTPASELNLVVRVTPGVEAHTHHFVRTGQVDSKFGFGLASGDAQQACERIQGLQGARLAGLHAHVGSQIFRLDPFQRTVSLLAPLLERFSLEELSVGGGLGVPYVAGESAPSISQWGEAVRKAAQEAGVGPGVRIVAEPGRSIVATAGVTLYTVGTIKEISGVRTYVSVDGGMSDNPRPVLYGSGYEAFLPARVDAVRDRLVRLVGKHCESGDVLISESWLPQETKVGDVLGVPVTGAYGYSMASNYNKVPRPAVVFVGNGEARVVVRRETYEDLVALEDCEGSVVSLALGSE
jgi:diaminopimelate decarboxylase